MNMDHKHEISDSVRKRVAMWKLEGGDTFTMSLPPGGVEIKHGEYVAYKKFLTQKGYLDDSGQVSNPFKLNLVWTVDFNTEYVWSDIICWPKYWERAFYTKTQLVTSLLPNIKQLGSMLQKHYLPEAKLMDLFESTNASDENYALRA